MACRMALFHLSFSSKVRAKKVYTFKFCTWTSMNAWDHRESSEAETQLELQWDCFPLIICRRSLQNEIWDCLAWLEFLTKYGQIKKMLSLNLIGGVWTRIDRAFFFQYPKLYHVVWGLDSHWIWHYTLHWCAQFMSERVLLIYVDFEAVRRKKPLMKIASAWTWKATIKSATRLCYLR